MKEDLKTADIEYIKERLDNIEQELIKLRKMTIYRKPIDPDKTGKAWNELMALSKEISDRWEGKSAVEEIKDQREK